MQELLKIIAQGLVEKPEEVSVTLDEPKEDGSSSIIFTLRKRTWAE